MCFTAKKIWDKLEVTYEGTSNVKESKINFLVTQYEIFKMDESETIVQMYSRFTNIINSLKALGKTYTQLELIRKILRSLLATWIHKVSAIKKSKDLGKYEFEELIGSLMTYEIYIQNFQSKNDFKKKGLTLKATEEEQNKEESSSSSSEDFKEEDELTMLSKRVQKLIKLRKKDKKSTKNNNKEPICYNCDKSSHFKADCFKKKKDEKPKEKEADKGKKKKSHKKGKRGMAAAWSDEDVSSSESSAVEEVGLMADFEITSSPLSSHFSIKSKNSDEEELSHEELVENLSDVCNMLKSVIKEKKNLQKSLESTLFEKENLQKDLSKVISDKKTLEERLEEKMSKSTPQTNK